MFFMGHWKKKCSFSLRFMSGYQSECDDLCCSFRENLIFIGACFCTLNTKSFTPSTKKKNNFEEKKSSSDADLLHITELPTHFHELYIHTAYRSPNSTPKECFYSLFRETNETLNVWTHLIGSIFFFCCFIYYLTSFDFQTKNSAYMWPFLFCVASASVFTFVSSMAHLFNTMSDQARHTCFFCDYAGVSLYGQCSAIACFSYSLPESWISQESNLGVIYLLISMFLSIASVYTSSVTRFWLPCPSRTVLRLLAFAIPYIVDNTPILLRLNCAVSEHPIDSYTWGRHYWFAFFSVFLYASHLPERVWPGKFDVYGQSHQLFHLLGVVCTTYQHLGFLSDLKTRESELISLGHCVSLGSTVCCISFVLIVNMMIVIHFSKHCYKEHKKR